MPVVANHHDDGDAALARSAAEADPYVMYLVVERTQAFSVTQALTLAAQATLACRDRFVADERHAEDFAAWERRSFRKVTLKARPGQWRTLLETLDCVVAGDSDGAGVACLPPVLRSERDPLLGKLQAHSSAAAEDASRGAPPHAAGALFVVPRGHTMSAGKLMAQVGHAALMLAGTSLIDTAAWRAAGHPCSFAEADTARWEALKAACDGVVVRDAGLTEIASGTETVMALPGHQAAAAAPHLTAL
jgi:peptidyl-tRNA hydrolase